MVRARRNSRPTSSQVHPTVLLDPAICSLKFNGQKLKRCWGKTLWLPLLFTGGIRLAELPEGSLPDPTKSPPIDKSLAMEALNVGKKVVYFSSMWREKALDAHARPRSERFVTFRSCAVH